MAAPYDVCGELEEAVSRLFGRNSQASTILKRREAAFAGLILCLAISLYVLAVSEAANGVSTAFRLLADPARIPLTSVARS